MDGVKLLEHLQQACQQLGVSVEPLVTDDELRAASSAAAAFLRECQAAGIDARELLQTLARRWSQLRAGALRDDSGRQIYLPGPVCFLSFFRFRREILQLLTENGD